MRRERQREAVGKSGKRKRGGATSNFEYLRVKCAVRFFPLSGPWECNALAPCLAKCVPYVWAFYPSVLSSPDGGETRQGAKERCFWLKRFFFLSTYTYGARGERE